MYILLKLAVCEKHTLWGSNGDQFRLSPHYNMRRFKKLKCNMAVHWSHKKLWPRTDKIKCIRYLNCAFWREKMYVKFLKKKTKKLNHFFSIHMWNSFVCSVRNLGFERCIVNGSKKPLAEVRQTFSHSQDCHIQNTNSIKTFHVQSVTAWTSVGETTHLICIRRLRWKSSPAQTTHYCDGARGERGWRRYERLSSSLWRVEARRQSPCALYSMGTDAGSCRILLSASLTLAAAAVSEAVLCHTAKWSSWGSTDFTCLQFLCGVGGSPMVSDDLTQTNIC